MVTACGSLNVVCVEFYTFKYGAALKGLMGVVIILRTSIRKVISFLNLQSIQNQLLFWFTKLCAMFTKRSVLLSC